MSKRQPLRMMSAVAAGLMAIAGVQLGAQGQTPDSRSTRTGVTVHGHWTIDVRNPDGTLASHTQFQNALTPTGMAVLAGLLSGEYVSGQWTIGLDGPNGLCAYPGGPANSGCTVVETVRESGLSPAARLFVFPNLERILPIAPLTNRRPAGTLGLSGFVKVTKDGSGLSLADVWTQLLVCSSDMTSAQCLAGGTFRDILSFTSHTLATPIPVTFGQIVQVKVELSFSAAQ